MWEQQVYFDYWNGPIIQYINKNQKIDYECDLANDIHENNKKYKNDNYSRKMFVQFVEKSKEDVEKEQLKMTDKNIRDIKDSILINQKNEIIIDYFRQRCEDNTPHNIFIDTCLHS